MKILQFLLFNGFTRAYLNSSSRILNWNKRIKSVVVEMWYTLAISIPCLFILYLAIMIPGTLMATGGAAYEIFVRVSFGLMTVALLNKDFFNGQSAVHRRVGYRVVDVKTNEPASKVKCMLRNITALVWFPEVIFALAYPQRRLGDFIAGTRLIEVPSSEPELILSDIRSLKMDLDAGLALLLSVIYVSVAMTLLLSFIPIS